jgi:hypothetical protein
VKIFRYPLEIVTFQQLQPIKPGLVLSVSAGEPITEHGYGTVEARPTIDLYAYADPDTKSDRPAPVLGVWIIGTGHPFPDDMMAANAMFHGSVDMRADMFGMWHVYTALIGEEAQPESPLAADTVDAMAEQIKARHAARRRGQQPTGGVDSTVILQGLSDDHTGRR